jgi:hypothetical protein
VGGLQEKLVGWREIEEGLKEDSKQTHLVDAQKQSVNRDQGDITAEKHKKLLISLANAVVNPRTEARKNENLSGKLRNKLKT